MTDTWTAQAGRHGLVTGIASLSVLRGRAMTGKCPRGGSSAQPANSTGRSAQATVLAPRAAKANDAGECADRTASGELISCLSQGYPAAVSWTGASSEPRRVTCGDRLAPIKPARAPRAPARSRIATTVEIRFSLTTQEARETRFRVPARFRRTSRVRVPDGHESS